MEKKEGINKSYVINYFNAIHPAKQMFVLNYSKRSQMKKEEQKEEVLQEVTV